MHAIILPVLGANMSHGTVRAWFKREGERVAVGDKLFEVETDKVDAEVEAEVAGVVRRIVAAEGTQVPVLGVVAFIGEVDEPIPAPETWGTLAPAAAPSAPPPAPVAAAPAAVAPRPVAERLAASPAARRLARERGISLENIQGSGARGEITRADVERGLPSAPTARGDGQLDPAFLSLIRRDAERFRALSSEMKVQLYRLHGAQIGDRVRIDAGAIILAAVIRIGGGSSLGADSTIECDALQLGRLVSFGKRTRVNCRALTIGDALWSKDDVVIGGGGNTEAGARLTAGDACFFGEGAYLNTCHPVTLGDEVCIGSRAMLFTHSHWQSILRGYPSLFGPIAVGDHVFIGNQAFLFPGVRVGAGATVMVNSFVALDVPADTLVGGVPAQVLRHVIPPDRAAQIDIVRQRLPELGAHLAEQGHRVTTRTEGERTTFELGGDAAVEFAATWSAAAPAVRHRVVVLTFVDGDLPNPPPATTIMDLAGSRISGLQDHVSDDVREFWRRRGVRFRPLAWRHGVGHFEGDRFLPR